VGIEGGRYEGTGNENARKIATKTQHIWHLGTPLGATPVPYIFRKLFLRATFATQMTVKNHTASKLTMLKTYSKIHPIKRLLALRLPDKNEPMSKKNPVMLTACVYYDVSLRLHDISRMCTS